MNITNMNNGHRERLRSRFVSVGLKGFSEHEIVELLLTLCIPRKDVKILAKQVLMKFGSLDQFLTADIELIKNIKNIGTVAPVAVKFIYELSCLVVQNNLEKNESFLTTNELKTFWSKRFCGLKNEVFDIALLDSRYRLIHDGVHRIEEGSKTLVNLRLRKIIELIMKYNAVYVVLAHNHIVGSALPSDQDERLTRLIKTTLIPLETSIIDHIIVGQNEVFSFREKFLL